MGRESDLIEVEHLAKSFEDPDGNVVEAVVDATLTCRAGEIYGLVGPNGAGKTTRSAAWRPSSPRRPARPGSPASTSAPRAEQVREHRVSCRRRSGCITS